MSAKKSIDINMNLTINLLKNHPQTIPQLAKIWHELLGKIWMPELGIEEIEALYYEELTQNMPVTYIALHGSIPVASFTLQLKDEIRPDLGPWIGDLVVDPNYQKQGIGKMLIGAAMGQAKELGFEKLYVFAFDPTIPEYYQRLGWKKTSMDEFKGHPVTVMEIEL
jgi:GNAT superfamily N-acetyltransferase